MFSNKQATFPKKYENVLIVTLRIVLALIFVWFGALKIFGYNPVFELVYNSIMPFLATGSGLIILGITEVFIGIFLLVNRAVLAVHIVLFLHLIGTFSTFIFGWGVIFEPYFPILSLDGEFVVKNLILILAALLILIHDYNRRH